MRAAVALLQSVGSIATFFVIHLLYYIILEAQQIQIENPKLNKPQPDMIYIEERLRNELRDKNESQDLVTKHYHEDKSPSNNSNDDIEDTQNIQTQYEEYSNKSSVDNDKVNDNAIGVNEDNGMMLQKNMEQDLLRELREHFQVKYFNFCTLIKHNDRYLCFAT